jgi:hypothetical protein
MFRALAVVLALGFVFGACSGGASKKGTAAAIETSADSSPEAETQSEADEPRTVATGGARIKTEGGTTTLTTPSGVTVTKSARGGPPIANLFTRAEDRIGMHRDKIVICAHASTTFGPAFNTSERDLTVYWEEVGKINGRTVEVTYENDNDDPTTAVQAARACNQKNPFLFMGGVSYDQVPAVRRFAEDNHMFYLHNPGRKDLTKRYSFSPMPTLEQIGDLAGQWVGARFKGRKVGIIYRDSENWDPARVTFVNRLKALRSNVIVAQRAVAKNQGSYVTEVNELHSKGAQLVFVWDTPIAATAIIQQAKGQNWSPQFLVSPWNVTTDALGDQALNPPVHGISVRSAYSRGDYTGPFASYANEIKRMEAAYVRWRSGVQPTDIHWWVWLVYRDLHKLLVECGKDCTRNKLLGLLLWKKYTFQEVAPSCPVDYTRNGHVGGFWATMFTAYRKADGNVGWRNIPGQICRDNFLS